MIWVIVYGFAILAGLVIGVDMRLTGILGATLATALFLCTFGLGIYRLI